MLSCDLHQGVVLSGDLEGHIKLWTQIQGQDDNVAQFDVGKHKGGVLGAIFWDSERFVTCSTDTSVSVFQGSQKVRNLKGHSAAVNAVCIAQNSIILSGSDDGSIGIWDPREKDEESQCIDTSYPVIGLATNGGFEVYSAGVDDIISSWDMRMNEKLSISPQGHTDIITSLSYNNGRLASHSHDNTVRVWDTKPFVSEAASRELLCLYDAPNGIEQATLKARFSTDGSKIIAGSADRTVAIWTADTGRLLRKIGGHVGCVNDVAMDGNHYVSASSDGTLIVSSL